MPDLTYRREHPDLRDLTRWRIQTTLGDGVTAHLGATARRHTNPHGGYVHRGFWVAIRYGEHSAYYVGPQGRTVDPDHPDRFHPFHSRAAAAAAVVLAWQHEREAATSPATDRR